MFDKILSLKQKGYSPNLILDVGAYKGTWTRDCLKIFSNCEYKLFEAIDYPELRAITRHQIKCYNVLLNDSVSYVDWYEARNTGDSMFCEKSKHFSSCAPIKKQTTTLDILLKDEILPSEIFIKIDCQGAEIPILKGATTLLKNVSFIVLELPFFGQYNNNVPSFLEHLSFMDSIGYIPYDVADMHYINGFNMQIDLLFIKKTHSLNKKVQDLLN
jgi:FkbM family methyltransferase